MNAYPMEPSLRGYDNSSSIHLEYVVSLIPVLIWSAIHFGWTAFLRLMLSGVTVCLLHMGTQLLQMLLFKLAPRKLFNLRALLVGILIALPMPSDLPIWQLLLADLAAVLLLFIFGSEVHLPFSLPALVASLLLLFPAARRYPLLVDSEGGKPLMALLGAGEKPQLSVTDMLLGKMDGNMGDVASLLILLGGLYLLVRRHIHWQIPLAGLIGAALTAYTLAPDTMSVFYFVGAHLFSGSFLLVLVYFASDRTSAPITPRAGLVYGALYGLLTIFFRFQFGIDGALPALLVTSVFSYPLDHISAPLPFGGRR